MTQASYFVMNASHSGTPIESALAVVAVVAAGEAAGLVVVGVVALFVVDSDFAQPIINIATTRVRPRISDFDI